jgi:hypothetical protein
MRDSYNPALDQIMFSTAVLVAMSWANEGALVHAGSADEAEPSFRYWIDFETYSSANSAKEFELAFQKAGGSLAGGPAKRYPKNFTGIIPIKPAEAGYGNMDKWDVLMTPLADFLYAALRSLKPGQLVGRVPGSGVVSSKSYLIKTLEASYGRAGAIAILPPTFSLPGGYAQWVAWKADNPGKVRGSRCWVHS